MSRKLNTTVVHRGEVFEAGTDEADIPGADAITAPGVWDGEAEPGASRVSATDSAEFAKAAKALDKANATIEELRGRVSELEAALAESSEGDGGESKGVYAALDVDALKAEIDKRNEGRDDAAKLSKRGGVDTLVGFLVADDAAQA